MNGWQHEKKRTAYAAALDELSETPTTQADFDSGKLKLVNRKANNIDETTYLLQNPANAAHLMESIAQLKAGEVKKRELIIDESFENMPPAGRELI